MWVLPLKLFIGALIGVLVGPGLLGFLSEHATYTYALYYGARPPLEGIPYLKAAITLGAMLLMLGGACVFLVILLVAGFPAWLVTRQMEFYHLQTHTQLRSDILERLRSASTNTVFKIATVEALVFGFLAGLFRWVKPMRPLTEPLSKILGDLYGVAQPKFDPNFASKFHPAELGLLAAVIVFVAVFLVYRPRIAWWFAAILTVVSIFCALSFMFNPPKYARFLRFVGYGGGIPVTVEFKEEAAAPPAQNAAAPPPAKYSAALLLRTTTALIFYDKNEEIIREIPMDKVKSLSHPAKRFHAQPFILPPW